MDQVTANRLLAGAVAITVAVIVAVAVLYGTGQVTGANLLLSWATPIVTGLFLALKVETGNNKASADRAAVVEAAVTKLIAHKGQ